MTFIAFVTNYNVKVNNIFFFLHSIGNIIIYIFIPVSKTLFIKPAILNKYLLSYQIISRITIDTNGIGNESSYQELFRTSQMFYNLN